MVKTILFIYTVKDNLSIHDINISAITSITVTVILLTNESIIPAIKITNTLGFIQLTCKCDIPHDFYLLQWNQ